MTSPATSSAVSPAPPLAPPEEVPRATRRPPLPAPTPARRERRRRAEEAAAQGTGPLRRLGFFAVLLRWGTVLVGLLLALTTEDTRGAPLLLATGLLVANACWWTLRPPATDHPSRAAEVALLADLAVTVTAVAITGRWNSPFVLTPVPTVMLAGFGWGYVESLAAAALAGGSVAAVDIAIGVPEGGARLAAQAGVVLLAGAILGGFTRRLAVDAVAHQQQAIDEMARMSTANDLLLALHDVAQTLPASLDLGEVVTSARARFRELFDYTAATILVGDDPTGTWRVELAEGVRLSPGLLEGALPAALVAAASAPRPVLAHDLITRPSHGSAPLARSGLYAPLRARGGLVGLVAIEHTDPGRYSERDRDLLESMAEPLALAIDNALWFSRLRTLGAEAERARIARDLHDRLAQSLAYVTFELERLSERDGAPDELGALRDVVRGVVSELRETLFQLRAAVSETADLAEVAGEHAARFQERTGIATSVSTRLGGQRLPVQVEQELWRILQEALTNVERHSGAEHAWITWAIAGGHAWLEIRDDGHGFRPHQVRRERFGLVGMRERADAVGAHLAIDSEPGRGTRVLVELEVPR